MRENSWGSRSVLSASARMDIRSLCPIAPSTEKSSGSRCSEAIETKYRLLPALPCASPCGRIHFLRAVIEIPRRTPPFSIVVVRCRWPILAHKLFHETGVQQTFPNTQLPRLEFRRHGDASVEGD